MDLLTFGTAANTPATAEWNSDVKNTEKDIKNIFSLHFTRYTALDQFVDGQLEVLSFPKNPLEHVFFSVCF